ncbi:MAG: hypothetical protein P8H59_06590 [Flavobacteriales bacterium]|nr:hypothetical protein [Flavobacteriales bacterium]
MRIVYTICVVLCGLLTPFASIADLTGVSGEIYAVDGVTGLTTYRIYADFDNPTDQLIAIFGLDTSPLSIATSTSFFQETTAGGPTSLTANPGLWGFFPDAEFDSWFTIGADTNSPNTFQTIGFDFSTFEAGGNFVVDDIIGGTMFVLPGDAQAFPVGGRVLMAQLTTDGLMDMTWNVQWRNSAGVPTDVFGLTLQFPMANPGCNDPNALNYDPTATEDDGSCTYPAPSFSGLSWEEVIEDGVTGYTTYRVYANFTNPFDQLIAVYGQDVTPLSITSSGSFYQDVNGGAYSSNVFSALFGAFPDLEYDSWVTIGTEEGPNNLQNLNVDAAAFEAGGDLVVNDGSGGAWFVFPNDEPAAFPDAMGRVLIAQLSTDGIVDMTVNLQYRAQDGTNPQEEALNLVFPNLIDGCTDPTACNYDENATNDDGSCILPDGCTDATACNFDPTAVCDDGSCILPDGCTNPVACNFDPAAVCDDGSCILPDGCTNPTACNFDPTAVCDDGSCILPDGCTDATACNFDPTAVCDDGSCILPDGCTDATACNFDPTAVCDDGSCIFPDGCTDATACNFDPTAVCDDGSCILPDGCTTVGACNYDPAAVCDDGSCEFTSCEGCTNPFADNYDPSATIDDGSCIVSGCTYPAATNYDMTATIDDGTCVFECTFPGCTDPTAINYNAAANVDDGSCIAPVNGCTDATAINYDAAANVDDGSCIATVFGCTDPAASNYDPAANVDNGGCLDAMPGCTDPAFDNYNMYANVDDGSCDDICIGDFDNDGQVAASDLLTFLGVYGTPCE